MKGFANDVSGYVLALKTLKHLFGQRAAVAHAVISQVTKGKVVQNDDTRGLSELYYNINDCLVTLRQLNYQSDMYSSETLRQAAHRLPFNLTTKWAEYCLTIRRRGEDPNLKHLCEWLQLRVMALKEAFLSGRQKSRTEDKPKSSDNTKDTKHTMLGMTKPAENQAESKHVDHSKDAKLGKTKPADPPGKLACPLCKGNHRFWKCLKYKRLEPDKKFEYVKSRKICFNCFGTDHMSSKCESDGRCQECETKHHPSLHKYFTENSKLMSSKLSTSGGLKEEEKVADSKTVGLLRASPKKVYLQIVQVRLHAENGKYFDTYAVLDTCSESTMMRNDVASRLGLKRKAAKVNIATVKDAAEQISTEVVTLRVSSRDGSYEAEVENVYLCPAGRFNMPSRPQLADDENEAHNHLDGVPMETVATKDRLSSLELTCLRLFW